VGNPNALWKTITSRVVGHLARFAGDPRLACAYKKKAPAKGLSRITSYRRLPISCSSARKLSCTRPSVVMISPAKERVDK
jgi:hypothetical protein